MKPTTIKLIEQCHREVTKHNPDFDTIELSDFILSVTHLLASGKVTLAGKELCAYLFIITQDLQPTDEMLQSMYNDSWDYEAENDFERQNFDEHYSKWFLYMIERILNLNSIYRIQPHIQIKVIMQVIILISRFMEKFGNKTEIKQ